MTMPTADQMQKATEIAAQTFADRLKSEAMARRSPEQIALENAGGLAKHKTLRDEFAGQAMAAIISKSPFLSNPEDWTPYDKTAIGAYDYADAMLEERKTTGDGDE